jgi:hypothetical protein
MLFSKAATSQPSKSQISREGNMNKKLNATLSQALFALLSPRFLTDEKTAVMNRGSKKSIAGSRLYLALASLLLLAAQPLCAQTKTSTSFAQVTSRFTNEGSTQINVKMPANIQAETLSAMLNGKDVTSSFSSVECDGGVCVQANLKSAEGLQDGKNVLSVIAKKNDGALVSGRLRFAGTTRIASARAAIASPRAIQANATNGLPTLSSFLPPAVAFNTVGTGGYTVGKPWLQIGTQNTYPAETTSYTCQKPNLYTVIVLDRQTLAEQTSAPESSPQCIDNGADLKAYLSTNVTSSDLVIVGSNQSVNSDANVTPHQLDTSDIGGRAYNCLKLTDCNKLPSTTVTSQDIPLGYMAIGVGGAASGTAYENYFVGANIPWWTVVPNAYGMLVEDANGNYNFQTSRAVEYTVMPNDPNNGNVSTISVGTVPGDPYNSAGVLTKTYRPPVSVTSNGLWMLRLQRSTLFSEPKDLPPPPPPVENQDACPQTSKSKDGKTAYFNSCGMFYDTGDSNAATAAAAYQSLMADLENADPSELVFLVSIGNQPGYPDTNGQKLIPVELANAFSSLGGTPETLTSLSTPGGTYSYVGCSGCGNSLGGHVVISTNLQAQQGQNGYIHGLLQPNLNGIFWPTQASLDQPDTDGAPTTDFTMQEVGAAEPVEWPEQSATQKLTAGSYTADSTDGQNAAYYYMSYQLITQYYIVGAQGDYVDDIHYYFTGGNNTFLDYHTFDPANLPFPGAPSTCYPWSNRYGVQTCFTQNDFNAVRAQMHNEIVYLTNVLQFMVTGSTNLKDVVASGNSSAAVALINAAASVKGSTLQPPPATPVKSNVSNILNLVGNVVSVGAAIASGGLTNETGEAAKLAVKVIGPSAGVITGAFGIASSATGGLQTGGGPAPLPSKDYTFLTTIGDLSSNTLQQTFTAGFDVGLDTILGDWYKLSVIGPKITDTAQVGFQAPTQASQLVGTLQIGQASQRNFYMALLPIDYSVQHYTYWWGQFGATNYPDMGARTDETPGYCNTWYFNEPAPSTINLVSKSYFSYSNEGPTNFAFWYLDGTQVTIPAPVDWFILASSAAPSNPGSGSQRIQLLDSQVASTLFDAAQLNIPMDAFLDKGGPMASVWWDSATNGFDHFPANQTCSFYVAGKYGNSYPPNGSVGGPKSNPVTVTLNIPATGVLGDNIALKATAAVASAPVTSGTISFQDGSTALGQAALDGTGTATLTVNTLALGQHTISASFLATPQYTASSPLTASLTIYANDPDLALLLSAASVTVTSGATSSPLNLQVTSKWGLAGPVVFTCAGLPKGASCNFAPSQVTLTAGSSATTSLTVTSTKQAAELRSSLGVFAAVILPLQLLWWRRKGSAIRFLCAMLMVGALGLLSGCAGRTAAPVTQPTANTVLVTATAGNISRSVPINLTVQ